MTAGITIPPEALEAAAMHLAENRLPEYSWLDLDEEMRGMYRDDARAAIRAALKAWPNMQRRIHIERAIVLPLTENTDAEA